MSLHTFTIIYFTVNVSRDSKLQSPSSSDPPISPVPIFHPATGDRPGEGRARPGCSCRRPDGNAGGGGRGEGCCRAQSRDTPRACGTRGGPFIGLCAARRRVVAKVKATARTARRACILPARSPPRAPPRRPPPRPPPPPPQPPQRPATAAVTVAPPPAHDLPPLSRRASAASCPADRGASSAWVGRAPRRRLGAGRRASRLGVGPFLPANALDHARLAVAAAAAPPLWQPCGSLFPDGATVKEAASVKA